MPTATHHKSPAVCITIVRVSGPTELCNKPQIYAGLNCWQTASANLAAAAASPAQEFGAETKHDIRIVFANGTVYDGNLCCTVDGRDCDIRAHVQAHLGFAAGIKPAHLSDADFALYQSMIPASKRQAAKDMLDLLDI